MLPCKQSVCGWHLVYLDWAQIRAQRAAAFKKGDQMSKTATATFAPSNGIFSRLMASIGRLLMSSARIAARNGDLPYFGL